MVNSQPLHAGLKDVNPTDVIDKNSPIPLHYQLEHFLRSGIAEGRFAPNETLPTEQELQDFFDLSRTPIRQAIGKLVTDGLVERRRSLGTVVIPHPFQERLASLTSFTEEALAAGSVPTSRLIEFSILPVEMDPVLQARLPPGSEVYRIRRVRSIDNQPRGIITSHFPVAMVPNLQPDVFKEYGPQQSSYYILETLYHIKLTRAEDNIQAVTLDNESAHHLQLPPNSPVLHRDRLTYDHQGRVVAHEIGLYHVRYKLEWNGREVKSFGGTHS
jgi:GntR family transcriptional regulator